MLAMITAEVGWTNSHSESWLLRAIPAGVLGFYTLCEVTHVVGYADEAPTVPVNVYSILVFEDRLQEAPTAPAFLNGNNRIELKSLPGWKFGVVRYTAAMPDVTQTVSRFGSTGKWNSAGTVLKLGEIVPIAPQFVPPHATESIQLNELLKNNFWNGAYVLEWFDSVKDNLKFLFDEPQLLQELSQAVQSFVPLRLASLSDRLGNVVIQLPVTVLMCKFHKKSDLDGLTAEIAWHSNATPRPLRATCTMEFDGALWGYGSAQAQSPTTPVAMHDTAGLNRAVVWDDYNELILAATGPFSYIRAAPTINMQIVDSEPRVFTITRADGSTEFHRVGLMQPVQTSAVGTADNYAFREWIRRRIYAAEESRLMQERRFVQYQPESSKQEESHKKALGDIRILINTYGQGAAWLWDPYLSANDLFDTLFHCQHAHSDLRALTSAKATPRPPAKSLCEQIFEKLLRSVRPPSANADAVTQFIVDQGSALGESNSNHRGLGLEYRIKRGSAGWNFHDRFLIFPNTPQGPLAWSLGTSINTLGKEHHILQRVDNGRLVADAFVRLWTKLDQPEHLIWKHP
jgi:hypothetical protein